MKPLEKIPLPAGWKWEKIDGHIADFRSGIARGEKSRTAGYPHLRMNNISNELRLSLSELWRIPATDDELRNFALQDGDILFNNTNSRDLVGKSCLFRAPSQETYLFSNHITRIRTKPTLDNSYLAFWINHLWLKGFFRDNCDIWVNQAAIRVEDLLFPTELPLPPTREEQTTIAADFEKRAKVIEGMRESAERQLEAIAAMQAAQLREFFIFDGSTHG